MKWFCFLSLLFLSFQLFARHGKGGSLTYEYLGNGSSPGFSKYKITVKHYIDCHGTQFIEAIIHLGFFDAKNKSLVNTISIPETDRTTIQKTSFNSCIDNAPEVCYVVVSYIANIELPDNISGYIISEQECCRIDGIINIVNSSNSGITNTNTIPGVINNIVYRKNSSPVFAQKDTAVICYNSYFSLDFSADDPDGDSLSYAFCPALSGGTVYNRQPNPPPAPPYTNILYHTGYSADQPLGGQVTISSVTGQIGGIAPATQGSYVIAICVYEYRQGVLIGRSKKEVQITVADCSLTAALLKENYTNCDNYTFNFENESTASNISSYYWDFGIPNSASDTSNDPTPAFTYSDTGTYVLKLRVSSTGTCTDSTSSIVKVYPGFTPRFSAKGSCYQSPFQFFDSSYIKYGTITNRSWNFGDSNLPANFSSAQDPSYQYASPGTATVVMKITSSKGCEGSYSKIINITDKPEIDLPFTDTLICRNDSLPIKLVSTGNVYSWAPLNNIIDPNSSNPIVYPEASTAYTVTVKDKACIGSATVKVNVVRSISVEINDTAICKTDTIVLKPNTLGLQFAWIELSSTNSLSSYTIKNPVATPLVTTTYFVTASLGHCFDTARTTVFVSPYPTVTIGRNAIICYGDKILLTANTTAPNHVWSPANTLLYPNTLNPVAAPAKTTNYILTVTDTSYCSKSVSNTVMVKVIPPVLIDAGNDTNIVVGQPLQLSATHDSTLKYSWSPTTGMYYSDVYDPVVTINSSTIDSITYKVTATSYEGCKYGDQITVKIFKTGPDIFVPSAFSPNKDGKNDVLRPVLAGVNKFVYFRIFDRWGQLIYSTNESGKGWDGSINGDPQPTGTYIYTASSKDYTGKTVFKKGTVVLIR